MKKLLIVNNNMKIGGVQKSLYNLLWSISDQYDITLFLFAPIGEYMDNLPERVHVCSCDSLFRYLGVGQRECANNLHDRLIRGFLACICKLLGRSAVMPLLLCSQKPLPAYYDCAISYLHNGNPTHFYGGVNEFVLKKTNAARRIAFLHCDYLKCGANHRENNDAYRAFDLIAACSDGCRRSFVQAMPELSAKCMTVPNFHRCDEIRNLAKQQTYVYASEFLHVIMVGRLAHEKGIDRAIRAIGFACAQGVPVKLHLIGTGSMEKALHELVCTLMLDDTVVFHGSQNNPYRFMCHADLLLMTSWHEAAPMVIDEARVLSLPVFSVKTTSSDEMVSECGCGWVCENDQTALNTALTAVLKAPERIQAIRTHLSECHFGNENAETAFAALAGR
mgnify:CR=1 FL=1